MNIAGIKAGIAKAASMVGYKFKCASPTIAVGAGVACLIGAGVVACIETANKLDNIVEKHNEGMEKIRDAKEKLESGEITEEELTEEDIKKATAGEYIKTAGRAIKAYAPAIALALLGVTLVVFGHGVLKHRHAAAVAAYAGLSDSFDKYRKRVADKFGDETEKLIFSGGEKKLITEEVIDPDTGEVKLETKDKIVTKKENVCGDPYCFIYDAANAPHTWSRTPGVNYTMLVQQMMWANERLQAKGYLTLNQVLESIGLPAVREGMCVGWLSSGKGDGHVDFGIIHNDDWNDPGCFTGGLPDYILNFNCYPIMAKMPCKQDKIRQKKGAKVRAER